MQSLAVRNGKIPLKERMGKDNALDLSSAEQLMLELVAAQNALDQGKQHHEENLASQRTQSAQAERKNPTPLELSRQAGVWQSTLHELEAQAVLAFPADAVEALPLTDAEKNTYLAHVGRNLSSWHNLMIAQNDLLCAFRQAGIPVAVLKGAAAAAQYPHPQARSMGDIDLITEPARFTDAFHLMKSLGWKNIAGEDARDRHAGFVKEGCPEVELHRHFSTCANKQQAHALDQEVFHGIPLATWIDVGGFSVPVLPPQANGLVLLAHINQHLGSGLGLRQILDWQLFVQTHLADSFWNSSFQQAAKSIGMEKLAVTTTALCKTYLGLGSEAAWFSNADKELVDDLLLYIVRKGNMGRKVESGAQKTQTVLHNLRSPAALVRYLYEGGCMHWKPARNHRWLAPAACLYQIGHIARQGFARGVGAGALAQDARSAKQEVDLLKRLEVTRM